MLSQIQRGNNQCVHRKIYCSNEIVQQYKQASHYSPSLSSGPPRWDTGLATEDGTDVSLEPRGLGQFPIQWAMQAITLPLHPFIQSMKQVPCADANTIINNNATILVLIFSIFFEKYFYFWMWFFRWGICDERRFLYMWGIMISERGIYGKYPLVYNGNKEITTFKDKTLLKGLIMQIMYFISC